MRKFKRGVDNYTANTEQSASVPRRQSMTLRVGFLRVFQETLNWKLRGMAVLFQKEMRDSQ